MTKSPVSTWLANCGLCLPRSRRAACEASRPRMMSLASMTCQERSTSPGFGEYVDTVQLSRSVFTRTGNPPGTRGVLVGPVRPHGHLPSRDGVYPGAWPGRAMGRTPTSHSTDRASGPPNPVPGGGSPRRSAGPDDARLVEHRFPRLVDPAVRPEDEVPVERAGEPPVVRHGQDGAVVGVQGLLQRLG